MEIKKILVLFKTHLDIGFTDFSKNVVDKYMNVFIPNAKYNKAVSLMNKGYYLEAISAFEALEGYKDSEEKVEECNIAILNNKYNDAIALMNAGQYDEAIEAFEDLDGYKDSKKQIENCKTAITEEKYQAAKQLYSSKKYEDAYYAFMNLYDYKDSDTMQTNSAVKIAETALARKDYEEAISWYRTAGKKDEVYNVKYQYVTSHKNNNDETTYDYLVDLKAAKYKDAATIYSQLYDWKITIIAVNNDPDSTVKMSSISKYDPVYIHLKITGGTPNATIKPYVTYKNPEGQTGSHTWSYYCSDGDVLWYGWTKGIYKNPEYGDEGILTVTFYTSSYSYSRVELATVEIVIGP